MRKLIPLAVIAGAAAVGRTGRRAPHGLKLQSRRFDVVRHLPLFGWGLKTKVRVDGLELPVVFDVEDDLHVYKGNDGRYYVVMLNPREEHAGLDIFDGQGRAADDVFLQDSDLEETLGPRGFNLAPDNIARRLADYIDLNLNY